MSISSHPLGSGRDFPFADVGCLARPARRAVDTVCFERFEIGLLQVAGYPLRPAPVLPAESVYR